MLKLAWCRTVAMFVGALLLGAHGWSSGQSQPALEATSADDARAWLLRIHQAANTSSYRGTLVYSVGGSMSSSRVWHYWVADQTWEKLESLDGRQRQIVRHNEDVHTIWPQARVAVIERREALPGWQATPQSVDPLALEQYRLQRLGIARVAGRDADVLLLAPDDNLRYAQRLWADRLTGLMLRAEVLAAGPERRVIEAAAFSEVEIGIKPEPKRLMQVTAATQGFRIVRPKQERVELADEGWAVDKPVKGFQLKGSVRRELEGAQAAPADAGAGAGANSNAGAGAGAGASAATVPVSVTVLQAVFTDGLAHVSLFIEPFDPKRHRTEAQASLGATSTVTLRRQDHWFTAVGDVPVHTLKLLAESLARKR